MTKEENVGWKYIGDGSHTPGLPPRDLADDGEDAEYVKAYEKREGVSIEKTGLFVKEKVNKAGADTPAAKEG